MRTVLIAQRNQRFATALAAVVSKAGYRSIICPGPWPPALRCIRRDVGYCPLTEGADFMMYDPGLVAADTAGPVCNLAVESAEAHPDVPLLLAWPAEQEPESHVLAAILARVPAARVVGPSLAGLPRLLADAVGAAV